MVPEGMTVRADYRESDGVLVLGFAAPGGGLAATLPERDVLAYLDAELGKAPLQSVVLDCRGVRATDAADLSALVRLGDALLARRCQLVLMSDDALFKQVWAGLQRDRVVPVIADESEIRNAIRDEQPPEYPPFSEAEMAEMESEGVTLEDVIREIEQLKA